MRIGFQRGPNHPANCLRFRLARRAMTLLLSVVVSAAWAAEHIAQPVSSTPAQTTDAPQTTNATRNIDADGFEILFDGQSLAAWRAYQQAGLPDTWQVADHLLYGTGTGPDLITIKTYGDFELQFEWKIEAGGNSGVIYRATEDGPRAHQTGIEYQIIDDHQTDESVPPVHSAGAIYGLYCEADKTLHPVGEFNVSKIVVKGNHLEHWLNDTRVAECEIGSEDWNQKFAASKFESWPGFAQHARGHIALQAHGHPVWFRRIRIRAL